MSNYTTDTYETKRDILTFSNKISENVNKKNKKLAQDLIYGMLSSKSCLLSDISRALNEGGTGGAKLPNIIDRLSTNLANIDGDIKININQNCFDEIMKYLPDDYVIVLNDDTDLNKEYSMKLEDLCKVVDASSQDKRLVHGYKVCEYTALTEKTKTPISLYSNIYSTNSNSFVSENDETLKGEKKVIEILKKYNKTPIFIRDRGYDNKDFYIYDLKNDNKFVTRLKKTRNLLVNGISKNVAKIASEKKGKISVNLMYKGENTKCYISYTKVLLPAYKEKELYLVTVHGLRDEEDMMFLTNLDVTDKESARRVVKLYFLRWRIEEYFKAKKAFKWENSLVRTLESMNNLNIFLTLAMTYIAIKSEKLETNKLSQKMLTRANSLEDKFLVYLSVLSTGIHEILKKATCGIRQWQNIETRVKQSYMQLSLF